MRDREQAAHEFKRIKYHEQLFISNWVPIIDIIRYNCWFLCRSNAFHDRTQRTVSHFIHTMSFIQFLNCWQFNAYELDIMLAVHSLARALCLLHWQREVETWHYCFILKSSQIWNLINASNDSSQLVSKHTNQSRKYCGRLTFFYFNRVTYFIVSETGLRWRKMLDRAFEKRLTGSQNRFRKRRKN